MWKQVFQGVLLLVIGLSLGYGSSQQFVVSEVKAQSIEIKHLKESNERIERRMLDGEQIASSNIASMSALMQKHMEQTSELITIIRTERAYQNSRNP
jgi:hypothetical protein